MAKKEIKLTKPDIRKPLYVFFPGMADNIKNDRCATCSKEVGEFRDDLSKKEYSISGMCQKCQDKVFN